MGDSPREGVEGRRQNRNSRSSTVCRTTSSTAHDLFAKMIGKNKEIVQAHGSVAV
jgi:hypothetical protein